MPDTFQALAIIVLALLPGALYVWAFERQVGRWGIGLSDRAIRFVGGSAFFHALLAPLTYGIWVEQWPGVQQRQPLSWWLWLGALSYVGLPSAGGTIVGWACRQGKSWVKWVTGPSPAPRAWDFLFGPQSDGWIRLRLKSGLWLGGAWADANGRRSYAAGYPEPADLFLAAAADVDPKSGEFMLDEDGSVSLLEGGLLVRWDEVEYLEFIDA